MNAIARDWLPLDALAGEPLRVALGAAVADWSASWFSGLPLAVASVKPASDADLLAVARDWHIPHAALAIDRAGDAVAVLVRRALDCRPGQQAATALDRCLLEGFEQRLLGDLALKVEQALGMASPPPVPSSSAASPFSGAGGLAIRLSDEGGGAALTMALPIDAAARFRKSSMPPPRFRAALAGRMGDALGGTFVTIEAMLGNAELPLAELRGLAPGDVLVLDAPLAEPVLLTLQGSGKVVARARMGDMAGPISLILES